MARWGMNFMTLQSWIVDDDLPAYSYKRERLHFKSVRDFKRTEEDYQSTYISDRYPDLYPPARVTKTIVWTEKNIFFKLSELEAFEEQHPELKNCGELSKCVATQTQEEEHAGNDEDGSEEKYQFILKNDYWYIHFEDEEAEGIKNSVGMRYIAELLGNPNQYIPVMQLVHIAKGPTIDERATIYDNMSNEQLEAESMSVTNSLHRKISQAESEFSRNAREKEKAKGEQLLAELQEAMHDGDPLEIKEAREEYNKFIRAQNIQQADDNKEATNIRTSVLRAIGRAKEAISKAGLEKFRSHLDDYIDTGRECSYRPDGSINWLVKK